MRTLKQALLVITLGAGLTGVAGFANAAGTRTVDPYTDGAVASSNKTNDIYSSGGNAVGSRDSFSDGAHAGSRDVFTDGA